MADLVILPLGEGGIRRSATIQAIVSNMPSELKHAYERDWEYISGLPKYEKFRALDILRWFTFAL